MKSLLPLLLLLSTAQATAKERDYLGWPFDARHFPPCVRYGCTFNRERPLTPLDGGIVHVSLKKIPAKLRLYLAPDQSVMGLTILVPGQTLQGQARELVQRTMTNAADQDFAPHVLTACLKTAWSKAPGVGDFERRGVILGGGGEHYGVECVVKRYAGVPYVGVLVFFDV